MLNKNSYKRFFSLVTTFYLQRVFYAENVLQENVALSGGFLFRRTFKR